MKANETITLDACLLALLHYGDSVPPNLHAQIQAAKTELADRNPEAVTKAVTHLRNVMEQDEQLKRLYTASREYLVNRPGQAERAKSAVAIASGAPFPSPAFNGALTANRPVNLGVSLIDLVTDILSSPDANYRANAQQVLNQPSLRKWLEQAPEELKISAKEFSQAVNILHPTKVAVMKKLDKRILTLDDIAYSVGISIESARLYVKSLWNEGYVRPIDGNFLKQIWLSFKGAPRLDHPPADDTYLKLTARGYFYLHPGTLAKRKVA
jgi:ribosomal protein S25